MSAECEIDVRFFPPPPELDGLFSTFYRAEIRVPDGGRVRDHLQPEWGNARFFSGDCPDARLDSGFSLAKARFTATGPSSMPTEFVLGTTRLWGIGMFPLGWAKFMLAPADGLANVIVDGDDHPAFADFVPLSRGLFDGPHDDEKEYARILDHFMARRDRVVPDEDRIRIIHSVLVDPEVSTVTELSDRTGIGKRTLERLCCRHFGFPPRLLLRRQRFMRSLTDFMLEPTRNWSTVIDGNYHDQAHFVRDFRSFMGMSPSEYARLGHPILSAFMQERARIWGSAAQTLDKPPG